MHLMIDAVLSELRVNFRHALLRFADPLFRIARAIFGRFRAFARTFRRSFRAGLLRLAAGFCVRLSALLDLAEARPDLFEGSEP